MTDDQVLDEIPDSHATDDNADEMTLYSSQPVLHYILQKITIF